MALIHLALLHNHNNDVEVRYTYSTTHSCLLTGNCCDYSTLRLNYLYDPRCEEDTVHRV